MPYATEELGAGLVAKKMEHLPMPSQLVQVPAESISESLDGFMSPDAAHQSLGLSDHHAAAHAFTCYTAGEQPSGCVKNLGGLAPSASLLCRDIDPKASQPANDSSAALDSNDGPVSSAYRPEGGRRECSEPRFLMTRG